MLSALIALLFQHRRRQQQRPWRERAFQQSASALPTRPSVMSRSRTMIHPELGLGNSNTAVGAGALFSNVDGDSNNAVGFNALGSNSDGLFNNVIGFDAMADNVSGAGNVAVGDSAGAGVEGDFNIYVGAFAGPSAAGPISESETIRIGDAFNVRLLCRRHLGRASYGRPGLRRWKRPARRMLLRDRLCRQTSCSNSKASCAGIEGHN